MVALGLVTPGVALAASGHGSPPNSRYEAGDPGVGDPYFPLYGNGGYDARHYLLDVKYDPATDHLTGTATIHATATKAAKVTGHRRRTRIVLGGMAGAAACVVAALLVVLALLVPAGGEISGRPSAAPVAMTELAGTPMHVTASLNDAAWGTRIDLNCSYDAGVDVQNVFYALRVTGKDGQAQQVATWLGVPGRVSTLGAATSLHPGEIRDVEVVTASGRPVLRLPR